MPTCLHGIAYVLCLVMIKAQFKMNMLSRSLFFFLELAQVIPGSSVFTLICILHQLYARAEYLFQGLFSFTFLQFLYNLNLLSLLYKTCNTAESTGSYGIG